MKKNKKNKKAGQANKFKQSNKSNKSKQSSKSNQSTRSKLPWKNKGKKNTLPQSPSREVIEEYKRDMQKIVDYANYRIDKQLQTHTLSTELYQFLDGDESKRFSISQLTDEASIREYMTELRSVLSTIDEGSHKAEIDSAIMEAAVYRGQFGNQHRSTFIEDKESHVRHYNMNDVIDEEGNIIRRAIDPDVASKAFAAYRNAEATYAGYIGREGQEMMFGSETLIILLYDFYEKNPAADYDFKSSHNVDDGLVYISEIIQEWIDEKLLELSGINYSFTQATSIIDSWDDRLNRRAF